jgi:hypothetical protein
MLTRLAFEGRVEEDIVGADFIISCSPKASRLLLRLFVTYKPDKLQVAISYGGHCWSHYKLYIWRFGSI